VNVIKQINDEDFITENENINIQHEKIFTEIFVFNFNIAFDSLDYRIFFPEHELPNPPNPTYLCNDFNIQNYTRVV